MSVGDIFAPIVIAVANLINPSYLTPLAVLNPKTPSNDTSLEVNCKIKKHKSANNELQKFIIDLEKTIENHRQTLAQTTDQVEKGEIEKKITEINKSISILEKSIIDRGKKIQNLKKTLLEKV